ncbi:glycosyltransferase family 4 protein [Pseudomonas sp. 18058]|uniref:MraY family glycosyltransferase n=1 Tax=Pseudomonas sp. 18058 TaxID=2681406 RepID=UPI0013588127|nr:glycosyltransferase family 4 protein [Pseudomonas sp. 18058]
MIVGWLLLAIFIISWVGTYVLRRYALSKSLIDVPNERSSHTVPTPRGGGVATIISFLLALPVLNGLGLIADDIAYSLLGAGALVAVVGFVDDHGHVPARWRLLGHFVAAGWALFWMNGLPSISILGASVDLAWMGNILAVIYLVWVLNLYNFMDGIDGIASVQAIFVCLGMCVNYWSSGHSNLLILPLSLSAAVAGFLYWNFPPARIFMGDAGSGFLGLMLGVLAIQAAWASPELLWCWIILTSVFFVDATWTLFRRLISGKKVYQAHCSHAYQHASKAAGSHFKVTMGVLLINVLWLLPVSILVMRGALYGFWGVLLAWVPLCGLAIRFRAGKSE